MIKAKLVLPDVAAVPSKEQSDWNVNDPEEAGYIKNRTHYKEDAISYIPVTESDIITFNDVAGRYVATINNASLTEGVYKVVIRGQEGLYESTKVGDTYNILVTNPDGISFSYIEGTNFITVVDENATTSYQTSLSLYLQDVDTTYHKLGMEYIPSDEIADEIFPTLGVDTEIASESDDVVTLKRGIVNNNGTIENSDEDDITLAKVAKTGSYNDLSDNPEIPTNTSDLINDGADGTSPFVTESQIVSRVQSNWTETNSEKPSFIRNKPSIKAGTGTNSIVEGDIENNVASGENSHAEGYSTEASGESSHAEGSYTIASGKSSHAEGSYTTASSWTSHAEGSGTTASGESSHAEGGGTTASGESSHAEGIGTTASGYFSHAEGYGVTANHKSQHVFGEYNVADTNVADTTQRGDFIEIVGNGTANNARSNARTLDWQGNEWLAGNIDVKGDALFQGDVKVNGKINNEVLDVDENCLIIDVCKRLDLSAVGNKVEIALPDGYVCDPRAFSLASMFYSSYGSDNSEWTTHATCEIKYVNAQLNVENTVTQNIANSSGTSINFTPFIKSYIKIEVTTACAGAPKPFAILTCRIFCHKE